MGCVASKRISDEQCKRSRQPAPHLRPRTGKVVSVCESSSLYETETSASLVNYAKGTPAFHGLLTGRSRPQLAYEQATQDGPYISRAVHQLDDSCAPPIGYDPQYGVLTVSDVVMSLRYTVIVTDNPDREGHVRKIVHEVFDLMHSVVNGWSEESEISQLNNVRPEKAVDISETLSAIFDIVDELYEITSGRFDPTCGVIKLAYIEALRELGRPPLPAEMNRYRFATDWKKRITRRHKTVMKANGNTIIDLDGVSKGFCVDLISDALHLAGYRDFYVDWAGEIKAIGHHPSGRPWRTALVSPPDLPRLFKHWKLRTLNNVLNESDVCALVNLTPVTLNYSNNKKAMCIATSGDYFQIHKFGYYHIIHTHTICPMKASPRSTGSVSVLASSCALADGLATAAMTCPTPTEAVQFLDNVKDRFPDKVFGFCVLGRNSVDFRPQPVFNLFIPLSSSITNEQKMEERRLRPTTTRDVFDELIPSSSLPSPSKCGFRIESFIVRTSGQLMWFGGFIDIDTLIPCSMCPEPKVSFIIPRTLTDAVAVFSADSKHVFKFAYGSNQSCTLTGSINFTLSVTGAVALEKVALVIASVKEVQHGDCRTLIAEIGGHRNNIYLKDSVTRDDFSCRPVVDRAKECFSEIPFSVCVAVVMGADGSCHGITVTSLVISDHAPDTFCFNIMHTSTFFAAFSGCGSEVTVYCLATGSDQLAETFAVNSIVGSESEKGLKKFSNGVLRGIVSHVEMVDDHTIVIAKLVHSEILCQNVSPLIWHRRRYVSPTKGF